MEIMSRGTADGRHKSSKTPIAILMLSVTMLFMPASANARCYSRWYYPWPQRCGVARQMVRLQIPANSRSREKSAIQLPTEEPDMPLPSLARADFDGGEADEPTRAKVLLRAALEVSNGPIQ
jgi:hypothetical protein